MAEQPLTSTAVIGESMPAVAAPLAPSGNLYPRIGKVVLDRVLAAVLLVLALPLLALVGLSIYVTMGGPVLFLQERAGKDGVPFRIVKFRTMRPDPTAEDMLKPRADGRIVHKHHDDPRITRLGRLVRRYSIDELPQLWNVIKGEMSLVGPRPELVEIVEHYEPWQHRRHDVRPGLTGLWQISARGDGMMHELTHIDLDYIRNLSLRMDLKLLLLTIPFALGLRKGL